MPNGKAYGLPSPSGKLLIYDYRTDEIRIKMDEFLLPLPTKQTNVLVVNLFSKEARLDIVPQVYPNNLSRYP
ncbi:MAG: hypothetical protein MH321_12405 [Leptospiraceae bacterium]|nr:hypothetical protein [Leptospiraceae bacterium]